MGIKSSVLECIGNTPLIRLSGLMQELDLKAELLGKLESMNPLSSVKDRAALYMIEEAENNGYLKPGALIIEPTSGNTGVGLAYIGRKKGYRVVLTMPETMSEERKNLLKALGAELILTKGELGMAGAIHMAEELCAKTPGAFMARQFDNPDNALAHYMTTGPEILADTEGKLDVFVAAAGTGGTFTGTSKRLKEEVPGILCVAVEPAKSPVLSGGKAAPHGIQGIGAGFVPTVMDTNLIDRIVTVSDEEAMAMTRLILQTDGLFVGISSGAALAAAVKIAREDDMAGKRIALILPDSGERYLSTGVFNQ